MNINKNTIKLYIEKLRARGVSSSDVLKKLRSVEKFIKWCQARRLIENSKVGEITKVITQELTRIRKRIDPKAEQVRFRAGTNNIKPGIFDRLRRKPTIRVNPSIPPDSREFVSDAFGIRHYLGIALALI